MHYCCTWMLAAWEVEPDASSLEKSVVLRPAGRPLMKGEMSTPAMRRPSSARTLKLAESVATSSRPSPGTYASMTFDQRHALVSVKA